MIHYFIHSVSVHRIPIFTMIPLCPRCHILSLKLNLLLWRGDSQWSLLSYCCFSLQLPFDNEEKTTMQCQGKKWERVALQFFERASFHICCCTVEYRVFNQPNNISLSNVHICHSPLSRTSHAAKVVATVLNLPRASLMATWSKGGGGLGERVAGQGEWGREEGKGLKLKI